MMFVYECPSLQDGERELKEGAARGGEVEGAIVLLDQGTNDDDTDEVRYSALPWAQIHVLVIVCVLKW